jgi:hypothetical protein
LIAATNHYVKRLSLMCIQDISPQRIWTTELVRIDIVAKTIAAMEHDVHGLIASWDPKACRRTSIDSICNSLLLVSKLDLNVESPEGNTLFSVQANSAHFFVFPGLDTSDIDLLGWMLQHCKCP